MTIEIKITKKSKDVLISLSDQLRLHKRGLENALYEIGQDVVDETRKLIINGPKTGRMYGRHQASAPGEAPANKTGKLAKSGDYKVRNWQEMIVGETAFYAKFLEDGTRKMKPRPHLIKAVRNMARNAQLAILENVKAEINK